MVVTSVFPLRLLMERTEGNPCFLDRSVQTLVEIFSHSPFQSVGSKIALSALIPVRLTHGHACGIFGLSFHLVPLRYEQLGLSLNTLVERSFIE
jgi:hypothetical protein